MHSYQRDYRYLLLNLIPQHRLPPAMRRDVELALVSGKSEDLRRQSVLALEELCTSNYLERIGLRRTNGEVVAQYKRKGGRYVLSVSVPAQEWVRFLGPVEDKGGGPSQPAAVEMPTTPETPPREPQLQRPPTVERPSQVEWLSYLPEITQVFTITVRTDPMFNRLEILLGTLTRSMGVPALRLLLLEDVVEMTDIAGDWLETVSEAELRQNDLFRTCIETGIPRLIPRSKMPGPPNDHAPESWDYFGVCPVFGLGKLCGILKMYFAGGVDELTKKRRLETAANLVKQVIEFDSQIENITSVDALTQIYNRHFYDTQVSVEIERAMRSGNEVSMLVIDLDDFKRVNDELGHKKGDEALRSVAELIRKNLRKVDLPFRYGGEEFVVLLPGTSEFESVHTAERLRRVIAEYAGFVDLRGRVRRITVSVGVSVFPVTAASADELFEQADAAMYRAKQLGKNRVVLYKQGMTMDRR
jgi:diguanylate cyclase (GGDEF)-like protein